MNYSLLIFLIAFHGINSSVLGASYVNPLPAEVASSYWPLLNIENEKVLEKIPSYESKLLDLAKQIESSKKSDREKGKILQYVAMFMTSSFKAVMQDRLSFKEYTSSRALSSEGNLLSELIVRREKMLNLIKKSDRLIGPNSQTPSMAAGAQIYLALLKDLQLQKSPDSGGKIQAAIFEEGIISDENFSNVLKAIELSPIFGLNATLAMGAELPFNFKQWEQLANLVRQASKKNRCAEGNPPKECAFNGLAPFRKPASVVMSGDAIFQYGVRLTATELEEPWYRGIFVKFGGGRIVKLSQGAYKVPNSEKVKAITAQWRNRDLINMRIRNTEDYFKKKFALRELNAFRLTDEYSRLYNCASCHTDKG